jgi:hypothetical protein
VSCGYGGAGNPRLACLRAIVSFLQGVQKSYRLMLLTVNLIFDAELKRQETTLQRQTKTPYGAANNQ